MNSTLRRLARLAAFLLVFVLLLLFANTHFIKTDTYAALTLQEMKHRDDIELAVVGSSLVRDHFNAALISEKTGLNAFSAAVPGLSLQGFLALTKELYLTNDPAYTVLVLEPYNFDTLKEDPNAQYKLMPYLTGLKARTDYYRDLVKEDGQYVDRFLMFRGFGAESPADVLKTIGLRYWPEKTYARIKDSLPKTMVYEGHGFLRHLSEGQSEALVRESMMREPDLGYYYEIFDSSKELLLRYKALCEEKGSKLLIVLFPNLTAHALAEPGFLPYMESLMRFCRHNDIECYNFQYAKPELMPNLDSYSYDLYHLNGEGADLFSGIFADFFTRWREGEDLHPLFYNNVNEYLASIDFITNVWLNEEDGLLTADCNRGPSVTPLYRFTVRDAAGNETLLQDYAENAVLDPASVPADSIPVVYAVPKENPDAKPVYYDLPPVTPGT